MNISIPESFHPLLKQKATQAGYNSIEEYALQILLVGLGADSGDDNDAWLREALADCDEPALVTQEALAKRKQEINALLIEGLESGPVRPMTPKDWQAIRKRVETRLGQPLS
jgi:hypothetical protein